MVKNFGRFLDDYVIYVKYLSFLQMSEFGYGLPYRPYGNPNLDRSNDRPGRIKNLDEIICYKCGENGHFANRCTKGHLAFLSANAGRRSGPPTNPHPSHNDQ